MASYSRKSLEYHINLQGSERKETYSGSKLPEAWAKGREVPPKLP